MKADFILIIFILGTFICATYAAPTNSDIQHSAMRKGLLLNQITKSQQENDGRLDVNYQTFGSKVKNGLQSAAPYVFSVLHGALEGAGEMLHPSER